MVYWSTIATYPALAAMPRCNAPSAPVRRLSNKAPVPTFSTPLGALDRGTAECEPLSGLKVTRRAIFVAHLGLCAFSAAATEPTSPGTSIADREQVLSASASRGETYDTKYYSYYVPRGWEPVDLGKPDQTAPSLESRFVSPDGLQSVAVTATQSSTIKQTFFQLQDISELGGPDAVFRLAVSGAKLLRSSSQVIEGEERDTGTIRGVVKQPDQTLYFYEAVNNKGQRLFITLAGRSGKIYKAKCAAPEQLVQDSSELGMLLEKVGKSFRLK